MEQTFRDYNNTRPEVRELYRAQRQHQCACYVQRMHDKYLPQSEKCETHITMSLWDALLACSQLVDRSDPDLTQPNIVHAFQTAEAIRGAGKPEWMQLCGLLHDLGKVLYLKGQASDGTDVSTQYGVVGDTYPVEIERSDALVFPEFNHEQHCTKCSTEAIEPGIGFGQLLLTFGHDEYLYQVLMHNSRRSHSRLRFASALPMEFLYVVRFHSFYAWHQSGAYERYSDFEDSMMLPALKDFSSFDLYTKSDEQTFTESVIAELKPYYDLLCQKFLQCGLDDSLQW